MGQKFQEKLLKTNDDVLVTYKAMLYSSAGGNSLTTYKTFRRTAASSESRQFISETA